ncbi:MAG TPA: amino acid synthesis family protein [Conexibacter sp.]|jgi:hypothetical protein
MTALRIRKWVVTTEEVHHDGGPSVAEPLVKVAVGAVIENPYAGRYEEDLSGLIAPSVPLAKELVARTHAALGGRVPESCGKAAIVGTAGEQEHGVACITTPFGDAMREQVDGITWVVSTSKVAGPGATIDIPLAYRRALFVREFYDTVTLTIPDGPKPDEIVVVAAMASRGRVHNRVGGLRRDEVSVGDGLR